MYFGSYIYMYTYLCGNVMRITNYARKYYHWYMKRYVLPASSHPDLHVTTHRFVSMLAAQVCFAQSAPTCEEDCCMAIEDVRERGAAMRYRTESRGGMGKHAAV